MSIDLACTVRSAVLGRPLVRAVELVGSRASGQATALSDWDFEVAVEDFMAVAVDIPKLAAPLELDKMSRHLLEPVGVHGIPSSTRASVEAYLRVRRALESRFGVSAPTELERKVLPALGLAPWRASS